MAAYLVDQPGSYAGLVETLTFLFTDIEGSTALLGRAASRFRAGLWQSRRTGERMGLAYASLGLACTAADRGDWQRAAELHGVAQSFLDRLTEPWQDLEDGYRRDSMATARAALGGDEFDRAYARGSGLSFDDAFSLAMTG
jgi:hypothetical protein